MRKIKNPHQPNQGKHIKVTTTVEVENFEHPIFCYRHLHKDYCLDQCDQEEKKSLIEKFVKLSQLTWRQIDQAPRHGLGYEKISIDSLKTKCPPFITEEVKHLIAFRYQGLKPFLGHRNRFILHVIFIDRDFSLYNHG